MRFQTFILRYQFSHERDFLAAFPAGCLMSSANPTNTTQAAAMVYPIRQRRSADVDPLASLQISVGRTADSDIEICASTVSKKHAYFVSLEGRLYLVDAGSSNGTLVNGKQLVQRQRTQIQPGITEVYFGDEKLFLFDSASLWTYVNYLTNLKRDSNAPATVFPKVDQAPSVPPQEPVRRDEVVVTSAVAPEAPPQTAERAADERVPETATLARGDITDTHLTVPQNLTDPALERAAWQKSLTALEQLFPKLAAVDVSLSTQHEPLPVYDNERGGDVAKILSVLEGMRPLINVIEVGFLSSNFRLKVYERIQAP